MMFSPHYREDGMSSVDIKSETDSLRPDSPKPGDGLLSSKSAHFRLELSLSLSLPLGKMKLFMQIIPNDHCDHHNHLKMYILVILNVVVNFRF